MYQYSDLNNIHVHGVYIINIHYDIAIDLLPDHLLTFEYIVNYNFL